MALPAILPLLLSGATTGYGIYKQNQAGDAAIKASESKMADEMRRQAEFDAQAEANTAKSLAQYDPDSLETDQKNIVAKNLDRVSSLIEQQAPVKFGSKDAPKIIKDNNARRSAKAGADVSKFANAMAKFGAQGQSLSDAGLVASAGAQRGGQINRNRMSSSNMLANEMRNAHNLAVSPIGDAATTLGAMGLTSSLAGDFGTFGSGVDEFGFKKGDPLSPLNLKNPKPLTARKK